MQKTMKKLLSIILAILMIVTTVPFAFAANVVKSGNCGANGGNVKWTLDSDGTLTISGTGNMADYQGYPDVPWADYKSDVKKLIIEDGVTSIAEYTAYGCFYATSIYIGKDVKSIGPIYTTFYCRDLETITVSEDNEYYKSVDNVLFSKDGKELLKVACKAFSGTYNVPDGVVKINKKAFDICKNIEKVVLPDSVEEIGEYAFYQCKSLKILDIGMAKISSVGNGVFEWIEHPVEVIADKDNEYVSAVNGSLFSKIDGTLFYAYVTDNKCVVPYGVKIIPEYTIYVEDGSVVVPDTVETIERDGINAFDSVVHYLGTESQFQEIYEGDMSDFDFEWQNVSIHYCVQQSNIPASCTDDGVTEWYCSTCDETIKYVTGYAFGHDIVEVEAKAPTCTEIGWDAYEYCTACDYSTYVELPITHTDANCDYKCDYNCGYVYETLDFSDAKAITEENGRLYIDGAEAEIKGGYYLLNEGKYKLAENIFKTKYIWVAGEVNLDLNGYVWDLDECSIVLNAPFSVYDTSAEKNGKITSRFFCTIETNNEYGVFSLYSGTIENNSVYDDRIAISASWASVNLYGGKVTGNGYALSTSSDYIIDKTVVLGDVVLESGEGYAPIKLRLRNYSDVKKLSMDVTDYTGESLEIEVEAENTGKFDILKGVSSADEAEKYKLNINAQYGLFHEKTEYDEATGDVNIYIAQNAITQQPSVENNITINFNNPAATLQWYEVEENHIGSYIVEQSGPLFEYDFKAGDILKVSTDSEPYYVEIEIGAGILYLDGRRKTATVKFNADMTSDVVMEFLYAQNPVSLDFTVIKETVLDGETGETLKNPECKKSYYCKATLGETVYVSDKVSTEHNIVSVDAKAPTCSAAGYEAYEYCTACDYTTYKELPKEIFHKDADKNNKCDDCSAELAFEINRNGELLYYDNPYIQGFQALYDAAQDGDVITLLSDVFAYTIEIRKELTYDLNGFNIKTASSRSINIYDNVTIRDSVGGGEIYLAVYIGAPCTIEGGIFNRLGVASGITLDSILSPCAGYYDSKGNAIDTTGKKSITDVYVIENHTEGDIYNCLGYKCAVCEKYYGEPNPDGHEYTEGVCDICGYDCPHEETYYDIIRPVQNADGTWGKGTAQLICVVCGPLTPVEEVERNHEGYKLFDETAAKLELLLGRDDIIPTPKESMSNSLRGNRNAAYSRVYTDLDFEKEMLASMTKNVNDMLVELEARIADGMYIKADFSYLVSLLNEINALVDNNPENIISSFSVIYADAVNFYKNNSNNPGYNQNAYDYYVNSSDLENQLEKLIAGLKDGSKLKADYTEIDEAIADLDEKLADVNLTDEAKAEIEDIKAQLTEMKKDPLSSKADVEELTDAVEELEAGIEDGSAVKVNGISEINKLTTSIEKEIIEKYGVEEYQRISDSLSDDIKAEIMDIINEAEGIEGSVKDNEEKLNELKARVEVIYAKIENCLDGVHNGLKFEVTEEAKCGENAIESATCTLCGETVTREVENSALTHSFTEYIYNEDATCEADGTKTAICDNGCRTIDTVTAENTKLSHTDKDGDKVCDDCEAEITDLCPDCGGMVHEGPYGQYICMLRIIIKLVISFVKFVRTMR